MLGAFIWLTFLIQTQPAPTRPRMVGRSDATTKQLPQKNATHKMAVEERFRENVCSIFGKKQLINAQKIANQLTSSNSMENFEKKMWFKEKVRQTWHSAKNGVTVIFEGDDYQKRQ